MPTFYNFRENGLNYSFDDIFVPVDAFRQGNLWVWGTDTFGALGTNNGGNVYTPVTTLTGGNNWISVSYSYVHCTAIKTDGTLWTWGRNGYGQLGTNDTTHRATPVTTFAGGTNWKQASGLYAPAAIKTDGTLWLWGYNPFGQLGVNDTTNRATPVTTFAGGTNWKQVSGSGSHTAAIKTDGTLWIWGSNDYEALGINASGNRTTPVTTFAGGTNWKQVSASGNITAAIKTDGTLWIWGYNAQGQLGTNDTTNRNTPVTTFAGGTNWKQVSAGYSNTAAIKTDGTLWIWGNGDNGKLGNGVTTGNISTPVTTFAGGTNWKQVSFGDSHCAAIKTDGTLWTWGYGGRGRLGNGVIEGNISTPVTTFAGGTNWKQVSVGKFHCAAIKTDGTLWTWGALIPEFFKNKNSGVLGNSSINGTSTPVTTFAGGTNWKQVTSANRTNNIAAIKTDGTLWTWGASNYGQLGNGVTTGDISTPVTTFAGGTNWKQVSDGNPLAAIRYIDPVL